MKHRLHHLPHYTQPIVSSFLKKSRVRIVPLFKDSSPQEASIYNYRSYFSSSVSTTTTSNDDASIPLTEKEKNLLSMSLLDAKAALEAGHTTSQELVASCLKQIQRTKDLNAYITTASRESLLNAAKQADNKRASHSPDVGVLEGIPIAVKDSFCTKDLPTTCASRMLKDFVSPQDATVVGLLRKAGALIIGKTNMDEFSMGSGNTHSYYGPVINPWSPSADRNKAFVSGGSSGGSAVAISSRTCFGALGGDTGGSVRLPAAYCGVVGLKPSYGRLSRYGLIAFASSLDTPGIFAKTVKDAALMLEVMAGKDDKDSTSLDVPVPNYQIKENINGLKVGIPKEYMVKELSQEIRELWEEGIQLMKDSGAEIIEVSLPQTQFALPAYYILAPAEASSNLSRYDGLRYGHRAEGETIEEMYSKSRSQGFGEEVQRRILLGTFTLSRKLYDSYYRKAQQVRRLVAQDFATVFKQVDVILHPTAPTSAFEVSKQLDPVSMYINDIMTIPASMAGLPAISVPMRISRQNGLPLGLQLVSRALDEGTLLNAAHALQSSSTRQWSDIHQPTLI